ncbi:MAG TPA: HD domain-containing protein [Candidatus Binataceae bacterium]|nr:HD domain-containing protein [Candidatus Binataceae bacterium]
MMNNLDDRAMLARAIHLAVTAHGEDLDRTQSEPYVLHPLRVMLALKDEPIATQIVGVLHDVVEDTDITLEDIRKIFGDEIAAAVDAMTRRKDAGEEYFDYVRRAIENPIARRVKQEDLNDNLSRVALLPKSDQDVFAEKYRQALAIVTGG